MDDKIVFFSTHCPKCRVVEMKLKQKNIHYEENNDVEYMLSLGLKSAPALLVNGNLLEFTAAVKWINER